MNREYVQQRWERVPEPIRELSRDNPVVFDVCNRFVNGQIVTWEEALSQMVLLLSKDWERQKRDYLDLVAMNVLPLKIPSK